MSIYSTLNHILLSHVHRVRCTFAQRAANEFDVKQRQRSLTIRTHRECEQARERAWVKAILAAREWGGSDGSDITRKARTKGSVFQGGSSRHETLL